MMIIVQTHIFATCRTVVAVKIELLVLTPFFIPQIRRRYSVARERLSARRCERRCPFEHPEDKSAVSVVSVVQ